MAAAIASSRVIDSPDAAASRSFPASLAQSIVEHPAQLPEVVALHSRSDDLWRLQRGAELILHLRKHPDRSQLHCRKHCE